MIKSYSSSSFLQSLTVLLIFGSSLVIGKAVVVSPSKTFSYELDGLSFNRGFDETEYGVRHYVLPIQSYPFSLYFYEANPESTGVTGSRHGIRFKKKKNKPITNSYILAIGMGHAHPDGITRWVWEANLNRPVGDKAKLVFSRSGNLALIEANGRIGWQTKTSNKGVVDIKLLPNGNLVLVDRDGGFVWQSFHYPTDTLLVGQGLGPGSSTTNKIVNGDYSMVLQGKTLGLFFTPSPKSASSKPFNYFNVTQMAELGTNITFGMSKYFYGAGLFYNVLSIVISTNRFFQLAYPKYDSTLSMLRLGSNGNLYIYTYSELPSNGYIAWEETYAAFSSRGRTSECLLPAKCGSFGLCEDNQCVACPTPKGLMGWDKKCKLPKLPSCDIVAANVGYYRVKDVEDYRPLSFSDGEGPMTVNECKKKCSNDCKCVVVSPSKTFTYGLKAWQFNEGYCETEYKNAKLVFSRSGNLALIDGDGHVGWQTRTSNKGVVDIKLLPNGNLSFYYPTNTLLVGQSLGPGSSSTSKIVNGDYSLVLQNKQLSLFFNPNQKSSSSKPFNYHNITQEEFGITSTFNSIKFMYLGLTYPKYNSTVLSILRLGSNGNLYIYTYYDLPANRYLAWKCGSFGICEAGQCVACPTPKGLMGWDKKCKLPQIPSCNASIAVNVGYFKVEDVEDSRQVFDYDGEGRLSVNVCMKKCYNDCKCAGFFYINERSVCSLVTRFNTLAKLHPAFEGYRDAYIKFTK
ncbi:hypothetical protein MKW94_012255 [Papaver nudicaule]|uniref:Bulb-type lectin domain-containing protein n=1 Tax=Papaver nudicaule TaxID=74823 RepID=A0AA41S1Z1_PAPNU|nr:hypothetical protein [Papaver nudicaule]